MDKSVPRWDEYFMGIARAVSVRSKDPNTKVGAVIVSPERIIIGTGYNGMPPGWKAEDEEPMWQRPTKYSYIIHAEVNAILHSSAPVRGSSLYVTLFPCHECIKLVASSGITRIVYDDPRYDNEITRKVCQLSNIKLEQISK